MPILNGQMNLGGQPPTPDPNGLRNLGPVIQVEIHAPDALIASLVAAGLPIPPAVNGLALIDTGASVSCVEDSVMSMLGVNPIGVQNVRGVAGQNQHSVYPAKLVFPPNVGAFAFSSMVGVNLAGQGHAGLPPFVALVGRDILMNGLLVYNGTNGSFTLALN
ncbi:MAG: hypothetical protein WCT03_11235, partial [Candidatus Obscuribacterales bacterium]|jgi:hypothetical protein